MMKDKIAELMVKSIVRQMNKMVGPVAYTHIRGVKEIKIDKKTKKVKLSSNGKVVKKVISVYQNYIGDAVKRVVILAALPVIEKHTKNLRTLKEILPNWVFESPDVKVLELSGLIDLSEIEE